MNPILDAMNNRPNNPVKEMFDAYKKAENPNEFLKQMAMRNPMIAQIAGEDDLKSTFYDMCRQRGVDPNTILNQFK